MNIKPNSFNLKLITTAVFACACMGQGLSSSYVKASSHSPFVTESNSLVHQQSLQASATETRSGNGRHKVPGGGRAV